MTCILIRASPGRGTLSNFLPVVLIFFRIIREVNIFAPALTFFVIIFHLRALLLYISLWKSYSLWSLWIIERHEIENPRSLHEFFFFLLHTFMKKPDYLLTGNSHYEKLRFRLLKYGNVFFLDVYLLSVNTWVAVAFPSACAVSLNNCRLTPATYAAILSCLLIDNNKK